MFFNKASKIAGRTARGLCIGAAVGGVAGGAIGVLPSLFLALSVINRSREPMIAKNLAKGTTLGLINLVECIAIGMYFGALPVTYPTSILYARSQTTDSSKKQLKINNDKSLIANQSKVLTASDIREVAEIARELEEGLSVRSRNNG